MTELAEMARARALFGELFELSADNRELPLTVLANLHRTPLRAPLEALIDTASIGVYGDTTRGGWRSAVSQNAQLLLNERYPSIRDGQAFATNEPLLELVGTGAEVPLLRIQERLDFARQTLLGQMLYSASQAWRTYDPLVMMSIASISGAPVAACLAVLELELAVDPAVRQMILDFAKEPAPAAA